MIVGRIIKSHENGYITMACSNGVCYRIKDSDKIKWYKYYKMLNVNDPITVDDNQSVVYTNIEVGEEEFVRFLKYEDIRLILRRVYANEVKWCRPDGDPNADIIQEYLVEKMLRDKYRQEVADSIVVDVDMSLQELQVNKTFRTDKLVRANNYEVYRVKIRIDIIKERDLEW